MYDMHYDLLTILFYNFTFCDLKANNQLLNKLKKIYHKHNIIGGIINLYFDEDIHTLEVFHFNLEILNNPIHMFEESLRSLKEAKELRVIPQDVDFLYGMEGIQTISNLEEFQKLIDLGLSVITPCYLKKSKIGCGSNIEENEDTGLTDIGKQFVEYAFTHNLAVDVSHASKKSFEDIISIYEKIKNQGYETALLASHSNCHSICNRSRNLTDSQILKLIDAGGYLGLFTNQNFLRNKEEHNSSLNINRADHFMKHLNHVVQNLKVPIDQIFISSDDMDFHPDLSYHNLWTYPLEEINKKLSIQIREVYGENITNKLMYENAKQFIQKVRKNKAQIL